MRLLAGDSAKAALTRQLMPRRCILAGKGRVATWQGAPSKERDTKPPASRIW
jgi:hypothetical protein